MKEIEVSGTTQVKVSIRQDELARALLRTVWSIIGELDAIGCEYCTDEDGWVYIDNEPNWCVSKDSGVGALIDAYNYLLYGTILKLGKCQ